MNVSADFDQIRRLGQEVQGQAGSYNSETKKIYGAVDNLKNSWKGADNQGYINKVNEQRKTIEDLGKVIENYGLFLIETANHLEKVQAEIKAAAGKL